MPKAVNNSTTTDLRQLDPLLVSPLSSQETCLPQSSIITSQSIQNTLSGMELQNLPPSTIVYNSPVVLFPIACAQCRKQHKRCNRKLPMCERCKQKGIACEYRESKRIPNTNENTTPPPFDLSNANTSVPSYSQQEKKKTKKPSITEAQSKSTSCKEVNDSQSHSEYGLSKRQVIDFYYGFACDGFPLVSRNDLEQCPTNYIQFSLKDVPLISENAASTSSQRELVALFLSVKAVCEVRCGKLEEAERSAKLAREAISGIFDSHESFFVASTYAHLTQFEIWNSRLTNAKFYLQFVTFYLQNKFSKSGDCEVGENGEHDMIQCTRCLSLMNKYEKNLENNRSYLEQTVLSIGNASSDGGRTFFDVSYAGGGFLYELPRFFTIFTGLKFPSEWVSALHEEVTLENCFEILNLLESIFTFVKQHMRERSSLETIPISSKLDSNSPTCIFQGDSHSVTLYEIMQDVVLNGLKIRILSKLGYTGREIIEQSALKITMTTQHDMFPLFLPYLVPYISVAALVHLRLVKMNLPSDINKSNLLQYNLLSIISNSALVYYEEILRKDMRAMNIMAKRFKIVTTNYSKQMKEMEETLSLLDSIHNSTINNQEQETMYKPSAPITLQLPAQFLPTFNPKIQPVQAQHQVIHHHYELNPPLFSETHMINQNQQNNVDLLSLLGVNEPTSFPTIMFEHFLTDEDLDLIFSLHNKEETNQPPQR